MFTFKDRKGREWNLELDIPSCDRVDASDFSLYYKEKFSIYQLDPPVIQKLIAYTPLTFAIIWAIVEPQARVMFKDGTFPIDPASDPDGAQREFSSGINSTARKAGQEALLEAVGDFFPELKTALSACTRQLRSLSEKLDKKVRETEPLLAEMFEEELDAGLERIKENIKKTRGERLNVTSAASHQ